MNHDPGDVAARIRDRPEVEEFTDFEDEAAQKLFTTLVGYDSRARLLAVFLLHSDRAMHQDELSSRAGVEDLDQFEAAMTDLLRLDVVDVADEADGIPYYQLNKASDTAAALDHVQNALMNEQVDRLSEEHGPSADTATDVDI